MANNVNNFRRFIMWMALAATWLLTVLSVLAAFFGPDKTKLIFNSIPLTAYWFALAALLVAGFIKFFRLHRRPGLLMVHLGCLLVLAGGLWGSAAGHQLRERFLGIKKIPAGYMAIFEGKSEKQIVAQDLTQVLGELSFSVKLNDFRLEYYEPDEDSLPRLYIETPQGKLLQLIARGAEEISLGNGYNRLKVVKTFRNFKILFRNGEKIVTDEAGPAKNPAVEVEIETADGKIIKHYVFERFADLNNDKDGLKLSYISPKPPAIRDYKSDIVVIENGKEIVNKTIEVNHPLHYGGYHFYQHSYDSTAQQYTILSVTSDSGLYAVYGGYWLLCLGVLWQFWFRHIVGYIKSKKR